MGGYACARGAPAGGLLRSIDGIDGAGRPMAYQRGVGTGSASTADGHTTRAQPLRYSAAVPDRRAGLVRPSIRDAGFRRCGACSRHPVSRRQGRPVAGTGAWPTPRGNGDHLSPYRCQHRRPGARRVGGGRRADEAVPDQGYRRWRSYRRLGFGLSGHAGLGLPDAFQRRRDFTRGHRAQPDP